jgi:hypothetical protein
MNQLKQCPFCGAKATEPCETTYGTHVIECTECTCDIEEDTISKAVMVWNTRHGRDK